MRLAITRASLFVGVVTSASLLLAETADAAPPAAAAPGKPAAAAKVPAKAPSAQASMKSGASKLDAGDAAGALVDFKAADAAKPSAETAHLIGLSEDRLGHFHEAVAAYERFVAEASATMAAEVDIAKKRIDEIKAMPATVSIASTPVAASVSIDGAPASHATPIDVKLAPGTHILRLTADGYEAFEREVDVSYGAAKSVSLELVAAPAPPPVAPVVIAAPPAPVAAPPMPMMMPMEPQETSWLTRKNVGLVTGAIAIVGVGLGTGFGIAALDNKASFDRNPTLSTGNDGNEFAVASDVAFGAAFAMGVTSALLLLTGDDDGSSSSTMAPPASPSANAKSTTRSVSLFSAAPLVAPHAAGASAVLHF